MPPTTIIAVIDALDEVIEEAIVANQPEAYFAYVYRRTTAAVAEAISARRFRDNERMETFDVMFANLYLDARDSYRGRLPCSRAWRMAFDANEDRKAGILQHIAMGMNAHINLDLGIAAGRVMRGKQLNELGDDFRRVNDILQEITEELQSRVARVSPVLRWMDLVGKKTDEKLLDFSMRAAREHAWVVAKGVWNAPTDAEERRVIDEMDERVMELGKRLQRPNAWLSRTLWRGIALLEPSSVGKVVEAMRRD